MRTAMSAFTSTRVRWEICALVCVLVAASAATIVRGQLGSRNAPIRDTDDGIKYARGQNVVPVYEGWVANPDGTLSLGFGSWNRTWEETILIPIAPAHQI